MKVKCIIMTQEVYILYAGCLHSLRLTLAPLDPPALLMKPSMTSLLPVKILFLYLGWFRTWEIKSETHLLICLSLLFVSGYPRTGIISDMHIFTSDVSSSLYISCLYMSTIVSPLVLLIKSPKPTCRYIISGDKAFILETSVPLLKISFNE